MAGQKHTGNIVRAIRQIVTLFAPDARDINYLILYAAIVGLLSLAVPIAANAIVNTVALASLAQPLVVLIALVLIGLSFAAIMKLLQIWILEIIQCRVFVRTGVALAEKLPRVKLEVFSQQYGPELVNRFLETVTVQKVATVIFLDGITLVFQTTIGLTLLALYHPLLLAFSLFLLLSLFFLILLGWGAVPTAIKESKMKYEVLAWLEEIAKHPFLYRSPWGKSFAFAHADALATDYLTARRKHFRVVLRQHAAALAIQALGSALMLGVGGWLVMRNQLTIGQLVAAELVVTTVLSAMAKMGKHLEAFYDLTGAADKLTSLFELPVEIETGDESFSPKGPVAVTLSEVSLMCDQSSAPLEPINLRISPGEKIEIFGESGSGKTELAHALFRIMLPESGVIEVQGNDLRSLRLDALRTHTQLVSGPELFSGTVIENIQLGREEIHSEEIRRVLDDLGLYEHLRHLPQGLQTQLTPMGAPLSLQHSWLLTLGRAVLGKPKLLIIDGMLDALNTTNRAHALNVLLSRDAPWTLLVFSQEGFLDKRFQRIYRLGNEGLKEISAEISHNPVQS